jgi:hypothetical protein
VAGMVSISAPPGFPEQACAIERIYPEAMFERHGPRADEESAPARGAAENSAEPGGLCRLFRRDAAPVVAEAHRG